MATRADVAKLAGVSASTVTYALTGSRPISEETRKRIIDAMQELDYTPNAMAAGLAGGRSRIVALLFPFGTRGITNTDFRYVVGAAHAARELGYHLLVWPTEDRTLDDIDRLSRAGMVDGVILMEVRFDDERVPVLQASHIPFALIGRTRNPRGLLYVDADFEVSGAAAIDFLVGLGHEAVAFINGPERLRRERYGATLRAEQGVLAAARRSGISAVAFPCDHSVGAGRAVLKTVLKSHPDVTALITMNEEATVGIVQGAGASGIDIPRDLSVLSYSSSSGFADVTLPPVTTLSPPAEEIGRAAARGLIRQLADLDIPPEPSLWAGEFNERASTGPAPRKTAHASSRPRKPRA